MEGARHEAEAMDLRAAEAASAYETTLDSARQEAVKLREGLREEGEAEGRSHLAQARQAVARKTKEAQVRHGAAMKKAQTELEARASELADDIVQCLIGKAGG